MFLVLSSHAESCSFYKFVNYFSCQRAVSVAQMYCPLDLTAFLFQPLCALFLVLFPSAIAFISLIVICIPLI